MARIRALPVAPVGSPEETDVRNENGVVHAEVANGHWRRLLGVFDRVLSPGDLGRGTGTCPVEINCLGPFRCLVRGAPVQTWQSGRARALFQYLVTHRDHPIQRDVLLEALWPDPNALAPGTSLKVAVHALRRTLSPFDDEASPLAVLAEGATYRFVAPDLWIDVDEFEQCYLLARSLEACGHEAEALCLYDRAAELYRGDFLEDLPDEWPAFRREALKDMYLFALIALAKAAVKRGDYQDGVVRCQQVLSKDACREDTYRLLMTCHARLGQRSRVRSWYELCVRTLRVQLDAKPEPETERVYLRALEGRA